MPLQLSIHPASLWPFFARKANDADPAREDIIRALMVPGNAEAAGSKPGQHL